MFNPLTTPSFPCYNKLFIMKCSIGHWGLFSSDNFQYRDFAREGDGLGLPNIDHEVVLAEEFIYKPFYS